MLEGAIYCALVAIWVFIGAARDRDRAGSMFLTVLGTLLMLRAVTVLYGAFGAKSGLLGY